MKAASHSLKPAPRDSASARPLWSILIPTYNSAAFLEESLNSVLAQDPGADRMEIIVVDDHSDRDDPGAVVERIAGDRVKFIKQPRNVGKVRNYGTGLEESRGMLIHQLHCDDRVRPGFYAAMEEAFTAFPEAGAFFCESAYIDEAGKVTGATGTEQEQVGLLDNWLGKIVVRQRIQTPSIVVRREVYENIGGFDRRLDAFEDWEMWIRIANSYPVGFLPPQLAEYRVSASNSSTRSMLDGTRARKLRAMLVIVDEYVPQQVIRKHSPERNREMAQYLTQFIPRLVSAGKWGAIAAVYRDALAFSPHPRTLYRLISQTRHAALGKDVPQ